MADDFGHALRLLEDGDVVGLPTETVYGLAARVDRPEGLAKIFAVKERPLFDPLIVHVDGIAMAQKYAGEWPAAAQKLAAKFWPGPLTLVLPKSDLVPAIVTSGLETVGLRVPDNRVALKLIEQAGVGLAAPSANRFGKTSPTRWEHVQSEFNGTVFSLKSDPSKIGIESTVLEVRGGQLTLHRQGAVLKSQIESALQGTEFRWKSADANVLKSPGQLKHHYMPAVPLVWVQSLKSPDEIKKLYLEKSAELPTHIEGVEIRRAREIHTIRELKLSGDPVQAARELYHELRVQSEHADLIYFAYDPQMTGEAWAPILERLTKAASLKLN